MKEQIQSYFESHNNTLFLQHTLSLQATQYFEGLSDIINNISISIEETQEQVDMLTPGVDPLSQVISAEIQDMRDYIVKDMIKQNIDEFLIVQYFAEVCQMEVGPVDTEKFNLKKNLAKHIFK